VRFDLALGSGPPFSAPILPWLTLCLPLPSSLSPQYVDDAHRALFGAETLNLWLAFICDFFGACMVLSVACLGIGMWRSLGSSAVGLAFSQSIQMLVFYTWSIRLVAESIGLFGSVEKIAWLANHTPQEAGVLEPPTLPGGGGGDGKATKKRGTAGKTVPALKVRRRWEGRGASCCCCACWLCFECAE